MGELDAVSVEIGKLTTACKSLKDGHEGIQNTQKEIFSLMRGMDAKLSKLSSVDDRVKNLSNDVTDLKMNQAKRAGLQMGLSGLFGGGVTLALKKIFENLGA